MQSRTTTLDAVAMAFAPVIMGSLLYMQYTIQITVPVANTVISGILIRVSHALGPIGLLIISGKKLEVVSVAAATPIIDMSMSGGIIIVCLSNNRRRRSVY